MKGSFGLSTSFSLPVRFYVDGGVFTLPCGTETRTHCFIIKKENNFDPITTFV